MNIPDEVLYLIAERLADRQSVKRFSLSCWRFRNCIATASVQRVLKSRLLYTERVFAIGGGIAAQCSNGAWKIKGYYDLHAAFGNYPKNAFLDTQLFDGLGEIASITGNQETACIFTRDGRMYTTGCSRGIHLENTGPLRLPPPGLLRCFPDAKCVLPFSAIHLNHIGAIVDGTIVENCNIYPKITGGNEATSAATTHALPDVHIYYEDSEGKFWTMTKNYGDTIGYPSATAHMDFPEPHDFFNIIKPTIMVVDLHAMVVMSQGNEWYGRPFGLNPKRLLFPNGHSEGFVRVPVLDGATNVGLGWDYIMVTFKDHQGLFVFTEDMEPGNGRYVGDHFHRLPFGQTPLSFTCLHYKAIIFCRDRQVWTWESENNQLTLDPVYWDK